MQWDGMSDELERIRSRERMARNKPKETGEIMTVEGNTLTTQDSHPLPPQPLLPPLHPLLGLHHSEAKRNEANIAVIINRVRSQRDEMDKETRWNTLAGKKDQLKELFIIAEKGINENRASMSRFYEIIKEERKHKKALDDELQVSRLRIEDYKQVQQEFTDYVGKYSIFEKFLENVAEVEESWRNVRDILDRFETLQSTSSECARMLENELDQAADLRKQMVLQMEENSSTMKALSNKLILLEVQRKNARDRRVYWEHMMQRIKNTVLDRVQESMSLSEGIHDLYCGMCQRLKVVPIIPRADVQAQVDFIHKTIVFFKEVNTIASGCKTIPVVKPDSTKKDEKKKHKKQKLK